MVSFPYRRSAATAKTRCLLVCLADFGALLPSPAAVGIPGEDALAAALIIRAVSHWDLHQFGERGNVKTTLWAKKKKKNLKKLV